MYCRRTRFGWRVYGPGYRCTKVLAPFLGLNGPSPALRAYVLGSVPPGCAHTAAMIVLLVNVAALGVMDHTPFYYWA